jgi:hypothetical protein
MSDQVNSTSRLEWSARDYGRLLKQGEKWRIRMTADAELSSTVKLKLCPH